MLKTGAAALLAAALAFPGPAGAIPDRPLGWVSDFAGILGDTSALTRTLEEVERKASVEIAVVTVASLEGMTIEDYSVKLAQKWKVGKKGKDNGVIIIVAPKEHKVRIEVGYGLESVLPDGRCGTIIREVITPAFKRGDFAGGIKGAVAQVAAIAEGKAPAESQMPGPGGVVILAYLAGAVLAGFGVGLVTQGWRIAWLLVVGGIGAWGYGVEGVWRNVLPNAIAATTVVEAILGIILAYGKQIARESRKGSGFWSGWGSSGGSWGGGGGGGGFGGFGGGSFGGGGASGSW